MSPTLCIVALVAGGLGVIAMRQRRFVGLPGHANGLVLSVLMAVPALASAMVLAGLRPPTAGFDTPTYVAAYLNLDGIATANDVGRRFFGNAELLWWPLQSLLRPYLGAEAWLAANFVLILLATVMLYRIAAKQHGLNPWLFAFVFLTYYFVYAGNAMRQGLALPVGAAGFLLVVERRHAGWLLISLAIGLHWSALVFLSAPLFWLGLFASRPPYLLLPLLGAGASISLGALAEYLSNVVGGETYDAKYELYFDPNHVSHVGAVWGTFNFWLSVGAAMAFFVFCRPHPDQPRGLHALALVAVCLILFGMRVSDVSERFMPLVLLLLPLLVARMINETRFAPGVKNAALVLSFVSMFALVVFSQSAQLTLGYSA